MAAPAAASWSPPLEEYVPRCTAEPERWTTTDPDTQAVAVCGLPAPSVVRPRGLPCHGRPNAAAIRSPRGGARPALPGSRN